MVVLGCDDDGGVDLMSLMFIAMTFANNIW